MNFDVPEMDCFGHIWMAVLVQALEDATIPVPPAQIHSHSDVCPRGCKRLLLTDNHYHQRTALAWFRSETKVIGSFQWVCSILNLDPEAVIEKVRQRRGTAGIRKHRRQSLT
jgi:hypothetical protein